MLSLIQEIVLPIREYLITVLLVLYLVQSAFAQSTTQLLADSSCSPQTWQYIGDGTTQFALAGGFGAYGIVFKDQRALRTRSQIVQAVLASGAVIQVLKHVTGRENPFVRTTPTCVWKIFPNQVDYHRYAPHFDAYPSGHICTSLATVIVIAENYSEIKWIRPAGYAFTTLVGLGMLADGIHWVSDYPLGLFIGYYFGMLAAHPEGLPVSDFENGLKVNLQPNITPVGTGLSLTMKF